MGYDLTAFLERPNPVTGQWECIAPPHATNLYPVSTTTIEQFAYDRYRWAVPRNYDLFAALAGFPNNEAITPVNEPRVWPGDLTEEAQLAARYWDEDIRERSWLAYAEVEEACRRANLTLEAAELPPIQPGDRLLFWFTF